MAKARSKRKSKARRTPAKPRAKAAAVAAQPKPADPRAEARRRGDPGRWGISAELGRLETARDVEIGRNRFSRTAEARRMDAFDALHAAGGLDNHQHQAAQRLIEDWALMLGVAGAGERLGQSVDGWKDPDGVTVAMITAQDRVAAALGGVGRADRALLEALIEPLILGCFTMVHEAADELPQTEREKVTRQAVWWRRQVERVTGETNPMCQGRAVRGACENLRLHYGMGAPAERLHPFGTAQAAAMDGERGLSARTVEVLRRAG